jgi:DNA helicase-2/ATP-dependent DNA helicase PcrA
VQNDEKTKSIYDLYQKKLKSCDALDFDDLLYLTVQLFKEHPTILNEYQNRWKFVLIDEYQDTNLSQYTIAKMLVHTHQNIFAVGDPDQSIYSWRGAKYQNILNFGLDFPGATIITLNQNYRSTNLILQAANALISHNHKRYQKDLWSSLGEGSKIGLCLAFNERQEADFITTRILQHLRSGYSLEQMAIFYRTNAQSRIFEDALLAKRIHYTIVGGISFYDRQEIKDILAYLKMIFSNSDLISFLRTINTPKRGLGPTTLDKIIKAAAKKEFPIFSFCEEFLDNPSSDLKLSPKQKEALKSYLHLIHNLRNKAKTHTIAETIQEIILSSNYLAHLAEDPETAQDRKENIDELLGKAAEWEEENKGGSLLLFLEALSLRTPTEQNENAPKIKMMTLHNSKGLEFDIVFLVGLEEDLLPHINSKDDPAKLEEERRLCYVGMTRAKKQLYISSARFRYTWGVERFMKPSLFLSEIPKEYTVVLKKDF